MSTTAPHLQPTATATQHARSGQARAAIAHAAERTGVDFSYLMAQAQIESGMDPVAKARTSSASGLYQFIDQTWLSTLDRHGDALGYGQLASSIETSGGRARITDPAMRDTIMGLRFDPQASSLMAGALANDNRAALTPLLGREPDASELYLAHFLGAGGASTFLTTLGQSPDMPAASILPRAASANRAIFFEPSGAPRSVSGVMDLVRGKVEQAMQSGADSGAMQPATASNTFVPGWYPEQGAAAASAARRVHPLSPAGPLPSMAQTLRASFDLGADASAVPGQAHVRNAYARLEAFGL